MEILYSDSGKFLVDSTKISMNLSIKCSVPLLVPEFFRRIPHLEARFPVFWGDFHCNLPWITGEFTTIKGVCFWNFTRK